MSDNIPALNISKLTKHAEELRHNALIFRDINQKSREQELYNAATALIEAAERIDRLERALRYVHDEARTIADARAISYGALKLK